jgi:hypothetical protein
MYFIDAFSGPSDASARDHSLSQTGGEQAISKEPGLLDAVAACGVLTD